jgi:choline-sulfatase
MRPDERPNLVLIFSCSHNARVVGCAGNGVARTPHLDALAEEGVRFTDVNCSYPLTVPSRMGFLTAQYPEEIGVYEIGGALASDAPTFAHLLGAAGYETVLCGKMHFQGPDPFHGFERRPVGDPLKALSPEVEGSGANRTTAQVRYAVQVSGYGKTGFQAFDRLVTERSCEFISSRRRGDRPYCLVSSLILPRNPLICSRELFEYYMDRIPPPAPMSRDYLDRLHPAMQRWRERRGVDDLTPEENRRGLAAYYGLVTELDRNVGRIVDCVKASPGAEETVIVYCADHGDMACEHGMWWKSNFYNGTVRAPLIVSWPGRFEGGRVVDAVISLIDVGPTLLEIAGAGAMPDVAGRSFAGFLREGVADWPNEVYSEFIGLLGDQPSCMVRSGPWKLNYYHEFRSYQLFNLREDPEEMRDLRDDPACRGVAEACLEKVHRRWSAERMLERAARKRRARQAVHGCGHDLIPHPVAHFAAPEGSNEFDFGQLGERKG